MNDEILYGGVKLVGRNQFGDIVYSARLSAGDYYDGDHPWDSKTEIVRLKMVRLEGRIFNNDGTISSEFENRYSAGGDFVGGRVRREDGTVEVYGESDAEA